MTALAELSDTDLTALAAVRARTTKPSGPGG